VRADEILTAFLELQSTNTRVRGEFDRVMAALVELEAAIRKNNVDTLYRLLPKSAPAPSPLGVSP